jgi:hypothetical protein
MRHDSIKIPSLVFFTHNLDDHTFISFILFLSRASLTSRDTKVCFLKHGNMHDKINSTRCFVAGKVGAWLGIR